MAACIASRYVDTAPLSLEREAPLSVHPASERAAASASTAHRQQSSSTSNHSTSNSGRALGPLTLHEFRDAPPLLHSHPPYNPLPPSYSLSLSLSLSPRLLFSLDSGKYRAHHEGITGKWREGGEGGRNTRAVRRSTVCASRTCARGGGER